MRAERRLISARRRVEPDQAAIYGSLWAALAAAVGATGAHAWRFVSPYDPSVHLEFLEFEASADPRSVPDTRALLGRLDHEAGSATIEEWLEERSAM